MAASNQMYRKAYENIWTGEINLETDDIKVALLQSGYAPSINTHENWDDLSNEVSGGSYGASGGKGITHTGARISTPGNTNVLAFGQTADDTNWDNSTITAHYAVVYRFVDVGGGTPHATNSKLLCLVDFGVDRASYNGDFKLVWDSDGIFKLTVNP